MFGCPFVCATPHTIIQQGVRGASADDISTSGHQPSCDCLSRNAPKHMDAASTTRLIVNLLNSQFIFTFINNALSPNAGLLRSFTSFSPPVFTLPGASQTAQAMHVMTDLSAFKRCVMLRLSPNSQFVLTARSRKQLYTRPFFVPPPKPV